MSENQEDKKPQIIIIPDLSDDSRDYSRKDEILANLEKAENYNRQSRDVPDVTDSADKRSGSSDDTD